MFDGALWLRLRNTVNHVDFNHQKWSKDRLIAICRPEMMVFSCQPPNRIYISTCLGVDFPHARCRLISHTHTHQTFFKHVMTYSSHPNGDQTSPNVTQRIIWVNYNNSLSWIVRQFGYSYPLLTMIPRAREDVVRPSWDLPRHHQLCRWPCPCFDLLMFYGVPSGIS